MTTRAEGHGGRSGHSIALRQAVTCALVGSLIVLTPDIGSAATPPVANPDVVELGPGSSLDIDVLANDSDDGGIEQLKVTRIVTAPAAGSAIVIDDIAVKFISPDPFTGATFTYEIDDGVDGTAIGEVRVNPPPPVCADIDLAPGSGGQALSDAIVSANSCPGPQVITVGRGTYDTAQPQITDSLTIRAADADARPVLIDTGQQPSSLQPVVWMTNAGAVLLENLVIRDAGYYPSLVSAGATNLTITGSSLEGSSLPETNGGAGVRGFRGAEVVVRDTVIHQADGFGVSVNTGTLVLDRVSISASSASGVSASNATGVAITASDIFDNSLDAIGASGVRVRSTEPVSITDTSIWGNPGYGIDADGPFTLTRGRIGVTPQGVPAGNFNGVSASPASGSVVIDGTVIAHNEQWGIVKQANGALTLTDVTVRDNVGPGLRTLGGATTATNTVLQGNGPDCDIARGTVVDGGGSTDSDGTCFPNANRAPVAVSDRFVMGEADTLVAPPGAVLVNDTDVDGDPLTATLEDDVIHGTLALQADGGFTYTPLPSYFGTDSFTYRADDGALTSEPVGVDITVVSALGSKLTAALEEATACDGAAVVVDGVAVSTLVLPAGWVQGRPELFYCLTVTNRGDRPATNIGFTAGLDDIETNATLATPLAPGETSVLPLGSAFGVPDGALDGSVRLLDENVAVIRQDDVRIVFDAPAISGAIDSWTTAGPTAFTACGGQAQYRLDGVATSVAEVAADSSDMWLCVSMRNNADGPLLLHELIVDPELPSEITPPRPFAITAQPGETVQRIVGPVVVDLAGTTRDAGFDVVWQADAPPFERIVSDRSQVSFRLTSETPIITITDGSGSEGDIGSRSDATFEVRLIDPVTHAPVVGEVRAQLVAESRSATTGIDFEITDVELDFSATSTHVVRVPLIGDTLAEGDESFALVFGDVDGARTARPEARGIIIDDDVLASTTPFGVRVGESAATACSGDFDPQPNPPLGRWVLPAGGVMSMPAFYCLEYTNLGLVTETLHRFGVEGIDDADLPFATTLEARVEPGESTVVVAGPLSIPDGLLRWTWTPYSAVGPGDAAAADTLIEVVPFDGDLVLEASIFGTEPTSCDGSEGSSLVVPYDDGPGTPGFSVWYCLTATNTGTAFAPGSKLVLDAGSPDERTVSIAGGLPAGQSRTVVVGPFLDHPNGSDGISPRTLTWVATGPGLVPGVDDQPIAEAAATVEVIRSSLGAPVVEIDSAPFAESSFDIFSISSVTVRRGPAAPAELDILVQTRAPAEVVGFVATPGTECGAGTVDYVALAGLARTLTVAAPSEVVDITICADLVHEPFEFLAIDVFQRDAVGGAGELLATTIVQLIDDDAPLAVNAVDIEVTEPDGGDETVAVSFPLSLDAGRPHRLLASYEGELAVSYDCALSNGVALGAAPVLGQFVPDFEVAAGADALEFDLVVCSDRIAEPDQSVTVTLFDYDLLVAGVAAPAVAEFEITVIDEDTFPVLRALDSDGWEDLGSDGTAVARFEVVTAPEVPWLFDATYIGGSAPRGVKLPCFTGLGDFAGGAPQVTVRPDDTEITVPIGSCPDAVVEDDYSVSVELRATGAFTDDQALPVAAFVTVRDDDTPPEVPLLTEIFVDEGSGGGLTSVPVSIPIFADAPSPLYAIRVIIDHASGDAVSGSCDAPFVDFEGPDASLFFIHQGDASIDFDIEVCADDVDEPDRTVWIQIIDQDDLKVIAMVKLTIRDDDLFVLGTDITVQESDGRIEVPFEVLTPSLLPLYVRTVDGTATGRLNAFQSGDFGAVGTLATGPVLLPIPPLGTGSTAAAVELVNDLDQEDDESFVVEVWDAPLLGRRVASATVTIIDDDRSYPTLQAPGPLALSESGSVDAVFTVLEAATVTAEVIVGWTPVSGGVVVGTCPFFGGGGPDVGVSLGPKTISRFADSFSVSIGGCDDLEFERDRSFDLVVSAGDGSRELARVRVTVVDDDAPPVVVLRDVAIVEGDVIGSLLNPNFNNVGPLVFEVIEPAERAYDVIVQTNGSGTAGLSAINCFDIPGIPQADGLVVSVPVRVEAGFVGPVTVDAVLACRNDVDQADRWYGIEVVDGVGESGGVYDSATVTIIDDDDSIPGVSISDAEVVEGDNGQVFATLTISVVGGSTPAGVTWHALSLQGGSPLRAAATSDFEGSSSNVLSFPPGGGTQTISVAVNGDTIAEGDEFFRVTISSTATVTDGTGLVRIVDDDALRVSATDAPAVTEGDVGSSPMTFAVALDSQPSGTVQVGWETNGIGGVVQPDDAAMATGFGPDRDFDAASGTLTFSVDGPLTQTVTVLVRGDDADEFNENVHLLLRSVSGAGDPVIGNADGVGRILDDDELPARPDIEPPVFVGVGDLAATIPIRHSSTLVYWNIRAEDVIDGVVDHACSPAPKTLFGVGVTNVSCTAADAAGNEATVTFVVEVSASDGQRLTDQSGDDTDRVRQGSAVFVTASGFLPGSPVLAELRSDPVVLAVLTADAAGDVTSELRMPGGAEVGEHTIALQGISPAGGARSAQFSVHVLAAASRCTITGTSGNDWLFGTSADDVICGRGGDDRIFGGGGDDVVFGGPGDDWIFGGVGDDEIRAGGGDDVVFGGRGDDTLKGNRGADRLFGGRGDDTLRGGPGADLLVGGPGDDDVQGGPGDDTELDFGG